ncbi:MAG TPA: hypothetical protein PKC33_10310, partial [Pseudomonadales bacterium]|nr:hypothetical protein [Pseudomonadales bacterium]
RRGARAAPSGQRAKPKPRRAWRRQNPPETQRPRVSRVRSGESGMMRRFNLEFRAADLAGFW